MESINIFSERSYENFSDAAASAAAWPSGTYCCDLDSLSSSGFKLVVPKLGIFGNLVFPTALWQRSSQR